MERRKVDILCVQETRWKGSKARSIGAGFKLFYNGVDSKRNRVGVVLKEEFVRNVLEVGFELEEKERFWSELDEVIPMGKRVVIGADFNGHVGEGNTGDEEKREEHRVTYKCGGRSTQVDHIVCGRGNLKENRDCKVVVEESVARQHRMVVCRMTLMVCKKRRSKIEIEKKTKWWKLKKEECCEEFRQKLRQALDGQVVLPDDWETTAEVIRETGRKVLGVSSGKRKEDKETWWWNEVHDSIQRKRLAKKKWVKDRTEENRQKYKELQPRVKREVSKAKQKAYDEVYIRLDTRKGQKDMYRTPPHFHRRRMAPIRPSSSSSSSPGLAPPHSSSAEEIASHTSLPPLGGFRPSRAEVVTQLNYASGDVARLCCSAVDVTWFCCSAVDAAQPSCSAVDVAWRFCSAVDVIWDPLALPPCPSLPPLASPCSSLLPLTSP
ncbi:hypothetical protein QTP70_007855 [Hemibagrus guttatus]|uniref:Endonuclease/exonuclease/phosphatase domain-containing protein n=1 Tax=Hemibagrus guttatus TaxID=175788 RepID=A0AAE0UZ71_9TELE|nr:hypothetical protein QTP70_007855 [Hemibagrus guttatus]